MGDGQPGEALRDYKILHEIGQGGDVSQRTLAQKVGIALGLTNQILKRLVRKGWVKTSRVNARKLAYTLTPQGFAEKVRLVMRYTCATISFFSAVRSIVRDRLRELQKSGATSLAILGTGELAEAVLLSAQEIGVPVLAVYDGTAGGAWFGLPILPSEQAQATEAAVLAITRFDEGAAPIGRFVTLDLSQLLDTELVGFAHRVAADEPVAAQEPVQEGVEHALPG